MLVSFLSICYNKMQSTVFRRKFRGASPYKGDLEDMGKVSAFLKRKNVLFSAKRYGIDAMGAMAQGLFASLLIGTIIKTLGQQLNVQFLIDAGNFAQHPPAAHFVRRAHRRGALCPAIGAVQPDCRRHGGK